MKLFLYVFTCLLISGCANLISREENIKAELVGSWVRVDHYQDEDSLTEIEFHKDGTKCTYSMIRSLDGILTSKYYLSRWTYQDRVIKSTIVYSSSPYMKSGIEIHDQIIVNKNGYLKVSMIHPIVSTSIETYYSINNLRFGRVCAIVKSNQSKRAKKDRRRVKS